MPCPGPFHFSHSVDYIYEFCPLPNPDVGPSIFVCDVEHTKMAIQQDKYQTRIESVLSYLQEQADRLPPGWSFHNESMISRPSWLTSQEDTSVPDRRVSIGTFMASRTDALGGISGDVSADSRVGSCLYM